MTDLTPTLITLAIISAITLAYEALVVPNLPRTWYNTLTIVSMRLALYATLARVLWLVWAGAN